MQNLKAHLLESLLGYFKKDYHRIEHALSVLFHAEKIAEITADVDNEVLIASTVLHDVGIKPAEELHGFNNGQLQEKLGPQKQSAYFILLVFRKIKFLRSCRLSAIIILVHDTPISNSKYLKKLMLS